MAPSLVTWPVLSGYPSIILRSRPFYGCTTLLFGLYRRLILFTVCYDTHKPYLSIKMAISERSDRPSLIRTKYVRRYPFTLKEIFFTSTHVAVLVKSDEARYSCQGLQWSASEAWSQYYPCSHLATVLPICIDLLQPWTNWISQRETNSMYACLLIMISFVEKGNLLCSRLLGRQAEPSRWKMRYLIPWTHQECSNQPLALSSSLAGLPILQKYHVNWRTEYSLVQFQGVYERSHEQPYQPHWHRQVKCWGDNKRCCFTFYPRKDLVSKIYLESCSVFPRTPTCSLATKLSN